MAVFRRSPRTCIIRASQIHIDNLTPYSDITANNGLTPFSAPRLRYNEITGTWQYSNDGLNYFNIGSGSGGSGSAEITTKLTEVVTSSPIAVESVHTIPGGESYTLGAGNYLDIYFNGQLLTHDSGGNIIDYIENTTTTIKFHFNVPVGSILQYMIRK